jgi:hypothetical protein
VRSLLEREHQKIKESTSQEQPPKIKKGIGGRFCHFKLIEAIKD